MLFRYGRDYYINDARRASGTRKKGSTTPEIPASPSAASRTEVSVEQLLEAGGESEESVPNNKNNSNDNNNYIMDKFLKESESQKTNKKVGNSGVSVLQRSVSLRSLSGNSHVSSPGTLFGNHNKSSSSSSARRLPMSSGRLDDDDNFSVLSLDRKMRDRKRRKSQHASEVQLSDNVLVQFEAKSLHADLKRDSFRARNGTTNFALNPIYDETVFVPPAAAVAAQVPPPSTTNSTVNYILAAEEKESQKLPSEGEEIMNNNISSLATIGNDTESTKSYFKTSYSSDQHQEEGRNNCIETSFESLTSLMRSRSTKLEAKDFGDDLY